MTEATTQATTAEALYERHGGIIYNLAYQFAQTHRVLDVSELSSVGHTAFMSAFQQWERARAAGKHATFSSYLYKVAQNAMFNALRTEGRHRNKLKGSEQLQRTERTPWEWYEVKELLHGLSNGAREVAGLALEIIPDGGTINGPNVRGKLRRALMGKGWTRRAVRIALEELRDLVYQL